jgi:uncharacterized ferritin-like protein (DUF455 family)
VSAGATGIAADVAAALAEPDVERKLGLAAGLCAAPVDPDFERGRAEPPARPQGFTITGSLATGRRADLRDPRGRRSLIHRVAHIELSAVELALLALADFPGEEPAYYADMQSIAREEIEHARLLLARLRELGGELGEEPLHLGLWQTAVRFDELPDRLAVVPRVLEAKGLDVSAKLRHELRVAGDERSAAALDRVYFDEIGHVALGTKWHRIACARRGLDPERHWLGLARPFRPRGRELALDLDGRRRAGFTENELAGFAAEDAVVAGGATT